MSRQAIDFMNDMRVCFGEFEFRVTTDKAQITSTGWPADPGHDVNQAEARFLVPHLQAKPVKDQS